MVEVVIAEFLDGGIVVKVRLLCSILALLCLACSGVHAAQTLRGTLVSWSSDTLFIKSDGDGKTLAVKPSKDAKVMRGQVGAEMKKTDLSDFAPGDRIVAVVNQDGRASSLKALYAITKGTVSKVSGDKVFFRDGRSVVLRKDAQIVFGDGSTRKASDLKPGTRLICRANPSTNEAWTVVATSAAPAKRTSSLRKLPKPVIPENLSKANKQSTTVRPVIASITVPAAKTAISAMPAAKAKPAILTDPETASRPEVAQPEISSIKYVGPGALKPRDWIRVELTGTPGGRATCEVKHLIPRTVMSETTPGAYKASVMIPTGKPVSGEALVGRLELSGSEALPVQASKLISVENAALPEVAKLPEPNPEPPAPVRPAVAAPVPVRAPVAVTPAPPAPAGAVVEQPKPEPPLVKAKAPVVVTAPVDGSKVQRAILITGTAEPGAKVMVVLTYRNGMGGILSLSGRISSQLIAVDDKGRFTMGPVPLEGPLATRGLTFEIKASYPDTPARSVTVFAVGDRT